MPTTIDGTTGASQIQDGTVTEAKIADGAVTAAKLAAGVISTTSVLAAIAGADVGAVGTYAFLWNAGTSTNYAAGSTLAGSNLRYAGVLSAGTTPSGYAAPANVAQSGTPSGTWRLMGYSLFVASAPFNPPQRTASLWLRIS
jgi:hypothetical protein